MDQTISGGQPLEIQILSRMAKLLNSSQQAGKIFQECLKEANITSINTSQDLVRFNQVLAKKGKEFDKLTQSLMSEIMEARLKQTKNKLTKALGQEKADLVIQECLAEAKLNAITSSQDMYKFALCLIKRGGTVGVIGHSLKIQAILDGAEQT
ncbi:MAG: hypothetical protein IPK14_03425 [Blastocatellia bacterium]|nr:hypothetical protein [Blastocatellia bacterium]MBL8195833.1 hypothetical protein [Blastocatellia bacterium]MBN8722738.1 hypothetical protein [Acidobacteriota bacterium]